MPLITTTPYVELPNEVSIDFATTYQRQNATTSTSVNLSSWTNGTVAVCAICSARNGITLTPPAGWSTVLTRGNSFGQGQLMRIYKYEKQSGDTTFTWTYSNTTAIQRWLTGFGGITTGSVLADTNTADTTLNATLSHPASGSGPLVGDLLLRYSQWSSNTSANISGGFPPAGHTSEGTGTFSSYLNTGTGNTVYINSAFASIEITVPGVQSGYSISLTAAQYGVGANVLLRP